MKTCTVENDTIHIKFLLPKVQFQYTLGVIKTLEGRKFHSDTKEWTCKNTQLNKEILENMGFEFETITVLPKIEKPIIPVIDSPFIDKRLYAYQKEGVGFIEYNKGTCLLADETGIGKTCQAVSYCSIHSEKRPVLIICPASLKINWSREVALWDKSNKKSVAILSGTTPYTWEKSDYVIINYNILSAWEETLKTYPFKIVIGDEIQNIANSTQRTRAFKAITKPIPEKIFLSGTPIRNRPAEFFNALTLLRPKEFPSKYKFMQRYCAPSYNRWSNSYDYKGASNIPELVSKLSSFMLRRLKVDVLKELPEKRRITIPLEMNPKEAKKYTAAHKEFLEWADKNEKMTLEGKKHVELLKQIAYLGKRDYAVEWISEFLSTTEEKLIVFLWHKEAMKDLRHIYKDAVFIDGSCTMEERQNAIDRFQNDPDTRIFLGNIIAAGTGITLTASSTVVFLELGWTPADHIQCEDRALRIGQKNTVSCYYLVGMGTVEEKIVSLIDDKALILNSIMDNTESKFFNDLLH